jgi:hypothetical protein
LGGRGLEIYENIASGRTAQDVGLFRGIFNALTQKLFSSDKDKLR